MKKILIITFLLLLLFKANGQSNTIDSLKQLLSVAKEDTNKVQLLINLGWAFQWNEPDSTILYGMKSRELSQQLNYTDGEIEVAPVLSEALSAKGNFSKAMEIDLQALQLAEETHKQYLFNESWLGNVYFYSGDYAKALNYYLKFKSDSGIGRESLQGYIGETYYHLGQLDSAFYYISIAYQIDKNDSAHWSIPYYYLALIEAKQEKFKDALDNYRLGLLYSRSVNVDIAMGYNGIAVVFKQMGQLDSALYYAKEAMKLAQKESLTPSILDASALLTQLYIKINTDSAFRYQRLMLAAKDSLFSEEKIRQLQNLSFNEEIRQQELQQAIQQAQLKYRNRLNIYVLLAGLFILLLVAAGLWRRNVFKQKAYSVLQKQKEEIDKQKREADIEVALERVRGKAMAMQDSSELAELVDTLYKELAKLDFALTWCMINIIDENTASATIWLANHETGRLPESYHLKFADFPYPNAMWQAWKERKIKWVYEEYGIEKETYENYLITETEFSRVPEAIKAQMKATERYLSSFTFSNFGGLQTVSHEPLSDSNFETLVRFGKVFDQTYTRFLDLKKAEAQSKEAQIQLSLERIRARAMAMHHSNELFDLLTILIDQFDVLGICPRYAHLSIIDEVTNSFTFKISSTIIGNRILAEQVVDINASPVWKQSFDNWKKGKYYSISSHHFPKEILPQTFEIFNNLFAMIPEQIRSKIEDFPDGIYVTEASCRFGFLGYGHSHESTFEEKNIVIRFVKEFELSYQRFLDLQKAEEQAREAQIEAALERIRAASMGMHQSGELLSVIRTVNSELEHLEIDFDGTNFITVNEDKSWDMWICSRYESNPYQVHIPYFNHSLFLLHENAQRKNLDFYSYVLSDADNYLWLEHLFNNTSIKEIISQDIKKAIYKSQNQSASIFTYNKISLAVWNFKASLYSDSNNAIFKRIGKVFEQSYTRYLDLQKAEAQAREANKRASVDRVRAEIASMRRTSDLERITPLIWNELTTLGVPFIRCGIFILDEQHQQMKTFLYTEGKTIASYTSAFSSSELITEALPYWHRNEIYKTHWDEAAFLKQAKSLVEQGAITSDKKYLTEHRQMNLYLHFLPFLQGMLYVGDATALSDEHLHLVQALADAFSTAYARYEDFTKLEAAKQQVDKTLYELKETQGQLIQSEKMASLGELTAGIAHEIQNPLNFVNNFSEVNKEMLEELKAERLKPKAEREEETQDEIINDVIENTEKINHHGKRADAIVKGMLQHSRQTKGVKEPTDINALCDEYLRLSYHGLRAKDKSFNAEMKTDFDESLGKINIIAQDIGRVLLNLFNNAFYACAEQSRSAVNKEKTRNPDLYKPTVSVTTKKCDDRIYISVSDNGNGIAEKNVDKIFQPFFTTKPTGEGTGLGLSLSYDIIKANGGEIKVETKEGEGSEFIIQLPLNTTA